MIDVVPTSTPLAGKFVCVRVCMRACLRVCVAMYGRWATIITGPLLGPCKNNYYSRLPDHIS